MAWIQQTFPFADATAEGKVGGSQANVPADGSAVVQVTFTIPYPTVCSSITLTPQAQNPGTALSAQIIPGSVTTAGFSMIVYGGAPGSTTTVDWQATGS